MTKPMSEIVAALIEQSETKFDLLGFDERPEPRPPIDRELLNRLEAWWTARTAERVPPEYVQFLLVCDGIENFSVSYSLLGARDLLSDSYAVLLKDSLDEGVSFDYDPERPPILIGYDPETRTKAFFEFSHERVLLTEPVFLEGNPGDMTLHPSFGAFLEVSMDANRHTVAELRRVREARDREGL